MGREMLCLARHGSQAAEGKAHRETSELVFRSPDLRLRIPFAEVSSAGARDGELGVAWPGGGATLERGGREGGRGAEAILPPPSRLDKLGVKDGQRISLLDAGGEAFRTELVERAGEVSDGQP